MITNLSFSRGSFQVTLEGDSQVADVMMIRVKNYDCETRVNE